MMKKLIAILVTLIFIFEGAGYCLRPQLYFGKNTEQIDKRNLIIIFPANDFLSYLFTDLLMFGFWRSQEETEDLNRKLYSCRLKFDRWNKLIRKDTSNFSSEKMARHYSEIVLFLKAIIPEIESIRNLCRGKRNRELMSRYIADTKNIIAGLESLLDNSYKEIDINGFLRKIHALVFSEYYRRRAINCEVNFRFSTDVSTVPSQQDKMAYAFLYLLYYFLPQGIRLDIETTIEIRGKQFISIKLYNPEANIKMSDINKKFILLATDVRIGEEFGYLPASKLINELGGEIDLIQDSGKVRGFKVLLPLPESRQNVSGAIVKQEAIGASL